MEDVLELTGKYEIFYSAWLRGHRHEVAYDRDKVLDLTCEDEQNYHAIQNVLADSLPKLKRRREKNFRYTNKKEFLLKRQDNKCLDCKREFNWPDVPTFEHIIPRRYGSNLSIFNVVLLCNSCNVKRDRIGFKKKEFLIETIINHYGSIT